MKALSINSSADGGLLLARMLLLGVIVAMLVSTSVAIAFELASYIAFAMLPEPRRRLGVALHQPIVLALVPFALAIVVAAFYGPTSWNSALSAVVGWRRLLLLPLALAIFDDEPAKRLVFKTIIVVCLIGTVISILGIAALPSHGWLARGVVYRNYATQGITFSLAIIICVAALLRPAAFAGDWLLGDRRIMAAAIVALTIDVVFVLESRSGYGSVIVMTAALVAFLAPGSWRVKALAGLGVLICAGLVLASSPHVRGRVEQGVREIETVDVVAQGTSMGQRDVMWRNTFRMIRDHAILGVGTGGFQDGYRPYVKDVVGWQAFETGDPHNQFLKVWGEQGLIGLAALLFFIVRAFMVPAPAPYRQLAAAALVGWCATSLANSHFSTFAEGRLLFFWLGAMLANGQDLKQAAAVGLARAGSASAP